MASNGAPNDGLFGFILWIQDFDSNLDPVATVEDAQGPLKLST